jgi:hypothetical protein
MGNNSTTLFDLANWPRRYVPAQKSALLVAGLLHGHGASAAWMPGQDTFGGYRSLDWINRARSKKIMLIVQATASRPGMIAAPTQ